VLGVLADYADDGPPPSAVAPDAFERSDDRPSAPQRCVIDPGLVLTRETGSSYEFEATNETTGEE